MGYHCDECPHTATWSSPLETRLQWVNHPPSPNWGFLASLAVLNHVAHTINSSSECCFRFANVLAAGVAGQESVGRENMEDPSTWGHFCQSLASWCFLMSTKQDHWMERLCEGVSWTQNSWWNSQIPAANCASCCCACLASVETGDKISNPN